MAVGDGRGSSMLGEEEQQQQRQQQQQQQQEEEEDKEDKEEEEDDDDEEEEGGLDMAAGGDEEPGWDAAGEADVREIFGEWMDEDAAAVGGEGGSAATAAAPGGGRGGTGGAPWDGPPGEGEDPWGVRGDGRGGGGGAATHGGDVIDAVAEELLGGSSEEGEDEEEEEAEVGAAEAGRQQEQRLQQLGGGQRQGQQAGEEGSARQAPPRYAPDALYDPVASGAWAPGEEEGEQAAASAATRRRGFSGGGGGGRRAGAASSRLRAAPSLEALAALVDSELPRLSPPQRLQALLTWARLYRQLPLGWENIQFRLGSEAAGVRARWRTSTTLERLVAAAVEGASAMTPNKVCTLLRAVVQVRWELDCLVSRGEIGSLAAEASGGARSATKCAPFLPGSAAGAAAC
jgi:hypothetical protein